MTITLALYLREPGVGDLVYSQYHDLALGKARNWTLNVGILSQGPSPASDHLLSANDLIAGHLLAFKQGWSLLGWRNAFSVRFVASRWSSATSLARSPRLCYIFITASPPLDSEAISTLWNQKQNRTQWHSGLLSLIWHSFHSCPEDQATGSPETEKRFYFVYLHSTYIAAFPKHFRIASEIHSFYRPCSLVSSCAFRAPGNGCYHLMKYIFRMLNVRIN